MCNRAVCNETNRERYIQLHSTFIWEALLLRMHDFLLTVTLIILWLYFYIIIPCASCNNCAKSLLPSLIWCACSVMV